MCGRRWGKTVMLALLATDAALAGKNVGIFCPTYKLLGPLVEPIVRALRVLPNVWVNRTLGEILSRAAAPSTYGRLITLRALAAGGNIIWV